MIKVSDCTTQLAGTKEELRCDFFYVIKELLNQGVYKDAQDISIDVARCAGLLNMSDEARLSMLIKYDIKATLAVIAEREKKESELMHEVGSDNE